MTTRLMPRRPVSSLYDDQVVVSERNCGPDKCRNPYRIMKRIPMLDGAEAEQALLVLIDNA